QLTAPARAGDLAATFATTGVTPSRSTSPSPEVQSLPRRVTWRGEEDVRLGYWRRYARGKGTRVGAPGRRPNIPRALRRSPKGERPRSTAGPRRRGRPKHSHRGHPVPGPWKRRSQAVRERKTSVLRACRVPNPAKRLNVVQRPKTLFEPQRSMTSRS